MMFLARQIDYTFFEQRIDYRNYASFKSIQTKKIYQFSSLFLLFISTLLLLSESNGMLFNEANLGDSIIFELEAITEQKMELTEDRYLVVSANKENVENDFVGFYRKYWLYSPNVDGRENFLMSADEFKAEISRYDKVILLDDHFTFNAMTELVSGKTFSPGIYDSQEVIRSQGWHTLEITQ